MIASAEQPSMQPSPKRGLTLEQSRAGGRASAAKRAAQKIAAAKPPDPSTIAGKMDQLHVKVLDILIDNPSLAVTKEGAGLLSVIERRLKAQGETKKPEPKEKPPSAGDPRMAEFMKELAEEAKVTPPAGSPAGPAVAHPTEGTASPSASGSP